MTRTNLYAQGPWMQSWTLISLLLLLLLFLLDYALCGYFHG